MTVSSMPKKEMLTSADNKFFVTITKTAVNFKTILKSLNSLTLTEEFVPKF